MEIHISSDLNLRDRQLVVQPLIDNNQLLVILEINEKDMWFGYPELIGKTGTFISVQGMYPHLFKLDKPIKISIGESSTEETNFHFTNAVFGVVHTNMNTLNEEISVHQGTDEEGASNKLEGGQ